LTVTDTVTEWANVPLVALTVTVYVPDGVEVELETVRVAVIVCPDASVTLAGLIESPGPDGDIVAAKFTVPEKPLTLVIMRVEVAEEPAVIVILEGFAEIAKSGVTLVLKVAVCTVSGTGWAVPFVIVTHVFGETLVLEQPVWNTKGIPELGAVTL
jgi:hypothetical protein